MGSFEKISADLREAMSKNVVFSILLGIGVILMFIGAGCILFDDIFGYYKIFGSWLNRIVGAIDSWMFLFGALGAYAAGKWKELTIGFGVVTFAVLWQFLFGGSKYAGNLIPIGDTHYFYFRFSAFVSLLILGAVTYFLVRKVFLTKK